MLFISFDTTWTTNQMEMCLSENNRTGNNTTGWDPVDSNNRFSHTLNFWFTHCRFSRTLNCRSSRRGPWGQERGLGLTISLRYKVIPTEIRDIIRKNQLKTLLCNKLVIIFKLLLQQNVVNIFMDRSILCQLYCDQTYFFGAGSCSYSCTSKNNFFL